MEKLVLVVIALIVLHGAVVLYLADVIPFDQNIETVRNDPPRAAPAAPAIKPTVATKAPAPETSALPEDSPAPTNNRHTNRVSARTPRVDSIPRAEPKVRRRHGLSGLGKPVRASASPRSTSFEKFFGDHVVIYTTEIDRPVRRAPVVARAIDDDNDTPKPKKNSLISKLQLVYKKPWELIKAVGSKLR